MGVWPVVAANPSLSGREGTLVCISIAVEASRLETLLEALARIEFPVNPQIYHEAQMVYQYANGHEESETITLVEFPAYAGRLPEVERAVQDYGFDADRIRVTNMLDQIQDAGAPEAAPRGAAYVSRYRRK